MQSAPVHVVAQFCPGSSLPKGTARVHDELASSAGHLKLPVLLCSCKGLRSLSNLSGARNSQGLASTRHRPEPSNSPCLALARPTVSRWPPDEPNKTNKDQQICRGIKPCTSYSRTNDYVKLRINGYDIAYNFTHNNIMLEHNAMNNMNTVAHMDVHNTQY